MTLTEVRADPVELTRLATQVLGAADGLTGALTAAAADFLVSGAVFGNVVGGDALHAACNAAADASENTAGLLAEILESDVDLLYHTAFAYQKADQDAAEDLGRVYRPGQPQVS